MKDRVDRPFYLATLFFNKSDGGERLESAPTVELYLALSIESIETPEPSTPRPFNIPNEFPLRLPHLVANYLTRGHALYCDGLDVPSRAVRQQHFRRTRPSFRPTLELFRDLAGVAGSRRIACTGHLE